MSNLLYLSWLDIDNYISILTKQIHNSGYKPNMIISVGRGGMIPSRLLSDSLSVPDVHLYNVKLYGSINTKNHLKYATFTIDIKGKNLLIVDDLIDSGETIEFVVDSLLKRKANDIKTAMLITKEFSKVKSTYCAEIFPKEKWIVFPWEKSSNGM